MKPILFCQGVEFAEAVVDAGLADAEEGSELGHREVGVSFAGFGGLAELVGKALDGAGFFKDEDVFDLAAGGVDGCGLL